MINKENININIYVGNHSKLYLLEDYTSLLKKFFRTRNSGEINTSNQLKKNCINIVIDGFTDFYINKSIKDFKIKNPETIIILIITEFIEKKYFVTSLNNFSNIFNTSILSLLNFIIPITRKDFKLNNIKENFIIPILLFPLALIFIISKLVSFILNKKSTSDFRNEFMMQFKNTIYMHMRYMGLKNMIEFFDAFIASHEKIHINFKYLFKNKLYLQKNMYLGTLYPEFNFNEIQENIHLFFEKKLGFEITGSITDYRQEKIKQIDRQIYSLGIKNHFSPFEIYSFNSKNYESKKNSIYSIHPPQSKNWPYSSPMRIYRSISKDYNFPCVTTKFENNPIIELCLFLESKYSLIDLIDIYYNKDIYMHIFLEKIKTYNQLAIEKNNILYGNISRISLNCDE